MDTPNARQLQKQNTGPGDKSRKKGYPGSTKPFELHIAASSKGLGAVLYQMCDGNNQVIRFGSRALGKSESNYGTHLAV